MQHSASDVQRFRHPGSGRRRGASTPKGRQLDPAALADVQALLAGRPRRRDLLIEHLHLIQDRYGGLSAAASRGPGAGAAAGAGRGLRGRDLLRTFRRREGRRGAAAAGHGPRLRQPDLRACPARRSCSTSCAAQLGPGGARRRAPCMGACDQAPAAAVGHGAWSMRRRSASRTRCSTPATTHAAMPGPGFRRLPGARRLQAAARCRAGRRKRRARCSRRSKAPACAALAAPASPPAANGAWCARSQAPRTDGVNGDEGEPGTFKDRHYLERDPHRFLEGMLIAA